MADRLFEGEEAVLHVIERIVVPIALRVDATLPWVDARLPDGPRAQTNFLRTPFPDLQGSQDGNHPNAGARREPSLMDATS